MKPNINYSRKIIYLAGFLFSLPMGLAFYINSNFLSSVVGEGLSGIIFTFAAISSIFLSILIAPKILKRIGSYKFLVLVAGLDALSFLALVLFHKAWSIVLFFLAGFCLNTMVVFSLDELLKIFSINSDTGKTRGTYLTVQHVALILAQVAIWTILGAFSFQVTYFACFLFTVLFLVVCFFSLKGMPEPSYDKINSFKYIGSFFRNKNLSRAYFLSFLIQLFYCWMIIYTPLYLFAHLGFSLKEIGFMFAVMLLPFLFIPMKVGKYADQVGERKMLMLGFFIACIFTFMLFFIKGHEVWLWAFALLSTRIGASIIESMSDTYFFKHIKPENEEFVGVYRSASPVAYVLGPIIASLVFIFVPSFNFIFIILGALMLYGVYLSSTIKRRDI